MGKSRSSDLEQVRWEKRREFFDRVCLVAIGDEECVIGLDNDEVIDAEEGDVALLARAEDDVIFRVNF